MAEMRWWNRVASLVLLAALGAIFVGPAPAEAHNRAGGYWTLTGSPALGVYAHTATLLRTGDVLVAGGSNPAHYAQLYDPSTGTWGLTGQMLHDRRNHTATMLKDGRVLIAGGYGPYPPMVASA